MPHARVGLSLLTAAAVLSSACGPTAPTAPDTPTESLTGVWWRTTRLARFDVAFSYLNLQQQGDTITGTACYIDEIQRPRYRAAPVIGIYPYVTFVVTETSSCNVPLCEGLVGLFFNG